MHLDPVSSSSRLEVASTCSFSYILLEKEIGTSRVVGRIAQPQDVLVAGLGEAGRLAELWRPLVLGGNTVES